MERLDIASSAVETTNYAQLLELSLASPKRNTSRDTVVTG